MRKLVFATNNRHKLEEVGDVLKGHLEILSLKEINCFDDSPETADTLEGNALLKAQHIFENYGYDCFADDTGLEVEALDGRPGVYSARYAGEGCTFGDNVNKVLKEMQGTENRRARFRCVISLIMNGKETVFEGIVNGTIANRPEGAGGFGYDPVFVPEGYSQSFAIMPPTLKNSVSHRGRAVKRMKEFLNGSGSSTDQL